MIVRFLITLLIPLNIFANELSKDYCIGYFEEVYWSLDPIEEEETRMNITSFFNDRLKVRISLILTFTIILNKKQFMNDLNSERFKSIYQSKLS